MKREETFNLLINFFIIALGLWILYMLFLKITGHSPTVDEITLGMVSFMAVWLVKMNSSQNRLEGKFSEFRIRFSEYTRHADRRFDALESDFKAHISRKNH